LAWQTVFLIAVTYSQNSPASQPESSPDDDIVQSSPAAARGWHVEVIAEQRRLSTHGNREEQASPSCFFG
jgi:hypothetical protein